MFGSNDSNGSITTLTATRKTIQPRHRKREQFPLPASLAPIEYHTEQAEAHGRKIKQAHVTTHRLGCSVLHVETAKTGDDRQQQTHDDLHAEHDAQHREQVTNGRKQPTNRGGNLFTFHRYRIFSPVKIRKIFSAAATTPDRIGIPAIRHIRDARPRNRKNLTINSVSRYGHANFRNVWGFPEIFRNFVRL